MSLSSASGSLLRACARQQLPSSTRAVAVSSQHQRRGVSADTKSSFDSPFGSSKEHSSTLKIPNFTKYSSNKSPRSNQVFSYFMAGTMGLASAVGAKATVQGVYSTRG
jgi:ubiquinol-cytochrome c reductase iron-sulfur subunit